MLDYILKNIDRGQRGFGEKIGAVKKGDFDTALKEWLPLAEDGNPSAQYNIGQLYRIGRGVDRELHQGQPII